MAERDPRAMYPLYEMRGEEIERFNRWRLRTMRGHWIIFTVPDRGLVWRLWEWSKS